MKKLTTIKKLIIFVVSFAFISLNVSVSYAQTTEDVNPEESEETTDDDSTTIVDVLENTQGEPEEVEEPEQDSSSGGSSGGLILGLVAAGAIVGIIMYNKNKSTPKIQKTFVSDTVSGKGAWVVDLSSAELHSLQSENSNKNAIEFLNEESYAHVSLPKLSFQYGSYEPLNELSTPFSFINTRLGSSLSKNVMLNLDVGVRMYKGDEDVNLVNSNQWVSIEMAKNSLLAKDDKIHLKASYSSGEIDTLDHSFIGQELVWQEYSSIFSQKNTGLQLAYTQQLSQNLRWQFLLQKSQIETNENAAKVALRYKF